MTLQTHRNIRRLRQYRGLSQQALADALGVTQGAVAIWENGGGLADSNLVNVARFFGVSIDVLMLAEIQPEPAQSVHSACTAPE